MKILITSFFLFFLVYSSSIYAQNDKVRYYLNKIASGDVESTKKELPDLLAEYPDDPGVQLLHAAVIEDGMIALEKYKKIVKQYPNSEWADDAYWRIVQFYAIIGDTNQAWIEYESFKSKYPTSEYLIIAYDAVKAATKFNRNPQKSISFIKKHVDKESQKKLQAAVQKQSKLESDEKEDNDEAATVVQTEKVNSPPVPEIKKITPIKSKFGLQVGIYSTQDAARAEMEKFIKQRLVATVVPKKVDDATMFAVILGDYTSKESAESAKSFVQQQCKCQPLIYEK